MPEKKTEAGRKYKVDAKKLTWVPEVEAGDEPLPAVTIPLRVKMKVLRGLTGVAMDASGMFQMIEAIVPGQQEVFDEMDVNDFQEMFSAWQDEYTALNGATPGE